MLLLLQQTRACSNGWKMLLSLCCGMPSPVSCTAIATLLPPPPPGDCRWRAVTRIEPDSQNFIALHKRLLSTCVGGWRAVGRLVAAAAAAAPSAAAAGTHAGAAPVAHLHNAVRVTKHFHILWHARQQHHALAQLRVRRARARPAAAAARQRQDQQCTCCCLQCAACMHASTLAQHAMRRASGLSPAGASGLPPLSQAAPARRAACSATGCRAAALWRLIRCSPGAAVSLLRRE